MLPRCALSVFAAIGLSSAISRATPIDVYEDLVIRDNKWNLNCSNAPDVVAGRYVDPASNPRYTT